MWLAHQICSPRSALVAPFRSLTMAILALISIGVAVLDIRWLHLHARLPLPSRIVGGVVFATGAGLIAWMIKSEKQSQFLDGLGAAMRLIGSVLALGSWIATFPAAVASIAEVLDLRYAGKSRL
jgi:hypothetical protein